jgi:hypothetical protein
MPFGSASTVGLTTGLFVPTDCLSFLLRAPVRLHRRILEICQTGAGSCFESFFRSLTRRRACFPPLKRASKVACRPWSRT